jgi:lipopolysaccharide transport system ATP-binding protein
MKPILEIHNISKKFLISHQSLPYLSLRDKLAGLFRPQQKMEEFWALQDVSFSVNEGESIGIIGKNGAGKSTLLKILSRITPPTKGKIISRGRIASLLEVGTGFHQELSGRENIYMNGSILGMKKREIDLRFDQIIDFSGVEQFLDTPLKHYSSGMQLRLAFAVAAHLDPEILIIDEVLAVGDAEFQRKCLNKMEDVTRSGRTIIFVSHNMDAIASLCTSGVFLSRGKVQETGPIEKIIDAYDRSAERNAFVGENEVVRSISIEHVDDHLRLLVQFENDSVIDFPNLGFAINDKFGHPLTGTNVLKSQVEVGNFTPTNKGILEIAIHSPKLAMGEYQLMVWFGDTRRNLFETVNPIYFSVGKMSAELNRNPKTDGFIIPECKWNFKHVK